jgi:hypothetical protein
VPPREARERILRFGHQIRIKLLSAGSVSILTAQTDRVKRQMMVFR